MTSTRISIRTNNAIHIIECKDITYCKADGRYTRIFLQNGENYLIAKVLKQYEKLLNHNCFFRIHKSYLVNLDYIKEYIFNNGRTLVLQDKTELVVSKRKCKPFTQRVLKLFPTN